jgi:diguanylate cyclase (GGDEF)-like protein
MATTELSAPGAGTIEVGDDAGSRLGAWRRPFECDLPGTRQEFEQMLQVAELREWPEVRRASLYGVLRHAAEGSPPDALPVANALLEVSQRDGDLDMVGLALAWRAWLATSGEGRSAVDEDLARAVVLLERPDGDPVVKTTSHFRVAFCMWERRMWELADDQLAAAEVMVDEVDPLHRDPLLHRAALCLDRIMLDLDRALTLRQVSDDQGVAARREAQAAHISASARLDMPDSWRAHIAVAALVTDVLAGVHRIDDVEHWLQRAAEDEELSEWVPRLHLALALCWEAAAPERASEAAETAVETSLASGDSTSPTHSMALHEATVLEARLRGSRTAGLRSAESFAAEREADRQAVSAGLSAAIAGQRLRGERDALSRQARSDPLTGLANRRGLQAHVAALTAAGPGTLALVLIDIDQFKPINDRFGHIAGDRVLQRVSEVMATNVRSDDFIARLGGDEFLLLLPRSDQAAASKRAEDLAAAVAALEWPGLGPDLRVTVSCGVAVGDPTSMLELTHHADAALYRAKLARRATAGA